MAKITVCVTNDLTYDQRMIRCCSSLADAGHKVTLVGRKLPHSVPLRSRSFDMVRLECRVNSGPMFYAEFNRKLRTYLLIHKPDLAISCDLDTILAVAMASRKGGFPFFYDSHEYFTEVPELEGRDIVRNIWSRIGRYGVPRAAAAYTVGPMLAEQLSDKYGREFGVVRNVPRRDDEASLPFEKRKPWILYQGALNEGRGLEAMITSMIEIDGLTLVLAGEGDLSTQLRDQVEKDGVGTKVEFLGRVQPEELKALTREALIGINLLEQRSRSYYFSLANKFFDYIQAGTPSINMCFPEYEQIIGEYPVAMTIDSLQTNNIIEAVAHLRDPDVWSKHSKACGPAAQVYNWDEEEKVLLDLVEGVLGRNTG